jgi:23S rRNA pseudouridine1911/1915/1917 synthase
VDGRVELDGRVCQAKERVRGGEELSVRPASPPPTRAEPDPSVAVELLFEYADQVVVNKTPGLVVHPARGHPDKTLVNGLLARTRFESDVDEPEMRRPGIVHRLDKDTSGLLVVAKNAFTREGLKQQLAAHSAERVYSALTHGVPELTSIETLYGRDPRSRLRFSSRVKRGKIAKTKIFVVRPLAGGRAALVECRLETGRTHQIRVHLSREAKTPILGDTLYGALKQGAVGEVGARLGRQALHAGVLGFEHPRTGKSLRFEAPWPLDFEHALSALSALDASLSGSS